MLPGPQKHLAQLEAPAYRDSPVLPVDVALEFEALDLDRSAGRARSLIFWRVPRDKVNISSYTLGFSSFLVIKFKATRV